MAGDVRKCRHKLQHENGFAIVPLLFFHPRYFIGFISLLSFHRRVCVVMDSWVYRRRDAGVFVPALSFNCRAVFKTSSVQYGHLFVVVFVVFIRSLTLHRRHPFIDAIVIVPLSTFSVPLPCRFVVTLSFRCYHAATIMLWSFHHYHGAVVMPSLSLHCRTLVMHSWSYVIVMLSWLFIVIPISSERYHTIVIIVVTPSPSFQNRHCTRCGYLVALVLGC